MLADHPEWARAMQGRLQQWLEDAGARFPIPDSQFDPAQRETRWQRLRTAGKNQLEKQHARFLEADFQPNPTWWGSVVD